MYSMRRFIPSASLLIILTVISMTTTTIPYISMLLASMLMILFTIKSLEEESTVVLVLIQILLSITFCISTAGFSSFLIFHEIYLNKRKWCRILFPAAAYGVVSIIHQKQAFPWVLFYMLVLFVISSILFGIEYLSERYMMAKEQMGKAVRVAAVNEMVERKLNQELTLKNYLIEKNARLKERETISRNIHNHVGHSMTAAVMTLDAADMLYDTRPEQARVKMNTANARIREGLSAIRHAVRVLDTDNEILMLEDLINNFSTVIEQFSMDTSVEILRDWERLDRTLSISREHTEFLTGALQELLTNGVKL